MTLTWTPVEVRGGIRVKRDDLFAVGGSRGGKVRTCVALAAQAKERGVPGLVTAGSRHSPQVNIVATVAQVLGLECRAHVPAGQDTPELAAAEAAGAVLVRHRPGYNTVIVARAHADAKERRWAEIPFGMEHHEAVRQTAAEVRSLEKHLPYVERIVVPVGSGMSAAGIVVGLRRIGSLVPVLGVRVGADPAARLNRFVEDWRQDLKLVTSALPYSQAAPETTWEGIELDPIYEAKCLPYLQAGDLFWIVGRRETSAAKWAPSQRLDPLARAVAKARKKEGDSSREHLPG